MYIKREKLKVSEEWCVDSGASYLMNSDIQFFPNIRNMDTNIFLADGSYINVSGIEEDWLICAITDSKAQDVLL